MNELDIETEIVRMKTEPRTGNIDTGPEEAESIDYKFRDEDIAA